MPRSRKYRRKVGSGIEPSFILEIWIQALNGMEMNDMRRNGWDLVKSKMLALSSRIAKRSLYFVFASMIHMLVTSWL